MDAPQVVIDNMMNIEVCLTSFSFPLPKSHFIQQLLLYTSKVTSNSTLLDMAVSHATKTMENHVRADGISSSALKIVLVAD
jgi:hypothetical protein